MKKILFIALLFVAIISEAQDNTKFQTYQLPLIDTTKIEKASFNAYILKFLPNNNIQSLSGTSITLNVSNGLHGYLTMSGNTVITLTNLPEGLSGNVTVINNSGGNYTIRFAQSGYTTDVQDHLGSVSDVITLAPGRYRLSYWNDGVYLVINGSKYD